MDISDGDGEEMITPNMKSRTIELEMPGCGHSTGEDQKIAGGNFPRGRW